MDVSDKGILHDGGFLLIPYFIFVAVTHPLCDRRDEFWRAARSGPIDAFRWSVRRKEKESREGLGMIPVLGSLAMAIGYSCDGVDLKICCWTFTGQHLHQRRSKNLVDVLEQWHLHLEITSGRFCFDLYVCVFWSLVVRIEKANKILNANFFTLFVILGIYMAFQPGAAESRISIYFQSR